MSARTTLYHNASAESYFGTLKREMLRGGSFASGGDARTEVFGFIEAY